VEIQPDGRAGSSHDNGGLLAAQVREANIGAVGVEEGEAAGGPTAGGVGGVGAVPRQAGAVEAALDVGAALRAGPRDRALVDVWDKIGRGW
jgi:hypothetical protein